ncbi:MAG: TonB-dependent receptor [Acidisphaera sp.]|nr:TonB-dependent receptor [Acidisphaera sp.]
MRRAIPAALLTTIALVASRNAQAQTDTTLPDVTVTATRVPTPIEDVPAGVTVITRQVIEERGYTTLVDALQAVPGLRVVQSGGLGGNASVFIRGTNSNHVRVLRDGVPINDPSDPGDAFNFGVDTLADVDRIEVVRGPMSALYGSGAVGGVINIITAQGEGKPHGRVELAAGLPRAVLGQAQLSGRTGRFDYNLSVQSRSDEGFDDTPQRESVHTGERDGFRSREGSLELGYTPIEGTRVSLLVHGRTSVLGFDELGYPAFDHPNDTGRDNDSFGRVGVSSHLFDGAWETNLFVARDQHYRRYVTLLDPADPNQASGDSRYLGIRTDVQWNNTVHLPTLPGVTGNDLTFGYEHIDDTAHERLNTSTDGFPYLADVDARETQDAGHVGLQTTVLRRLALTGELREEGVSDEGNAFTWRIGGSLAVPELRSHLKAAYGTAFLAASLFDRFGVDSDGYVGNPALKPERSRSWEIGWSTDLPAFGRSDFVSAAVTYFHTDVDDLIETVFSPVYTSENVQRATLQGVESSVSVHPLRWLEAVLAYTYTDARNRADNSQLLRRPFDQASLNLRLTPLPGLTIAPEVLYIGGSSDEIVDNDGFPIGVGRTRSGVIVNLNATYQVHPHVALFVWARNIGGSHFEPASGYQLPGPSFLAGTRLSF